MKYTISCLAIFFSVILHAQTKSDPDWHFGIKGDVNLSNINGNGMPGSYTTGFQFGGFAEKAFNNKWSVQPELLFSQNNTKVDVTNFLVYYTPPQGNVFAASNIKLGYISVPVMLKYNINKYFSVLAGPQYSQMLFDAESLLKDDKGIAFKRYEVSVNGGAQVNLGSVAIYARYNQGLTNINNIDSRYKWNSSHIQFGIAVKVK